jgi:co-chaperonin GroES (HSP10)
MSWEEFLESQCASLLAGMEMSTEGKTSHLVDSAGEKYSFWALASSGFRLEGSMYVGYHSQEEAVDLYLKQLKAHLDQYPGCVLYWRERPNLGEVNGMWSVYSRLLITPNVNLKNPDMTAPKETSTYLQPGWRTTRKGPNPENKSGFRATGHRILLVPEEVEKKTESGIVLVEKTVFAEEQKAVIATVLEIGPDAWSDKSTDYCEVGDRVLYGQYVGKFHKSPIDGKVYRFVSDLDIITPIVKVEE